MPPITEQEVCMADIKLIVMDMDGTLLNSNKEISIYTKNLLKELGTEGYKLGIASGRPIIGLKRTIEALGIGAYINFMTGSNGAELYDADRDKEECFYQLGPEIIDEIINLYKPFNLNPYVYQGDNCYAYRNDSTIERAARNNHLGIVLCNMKEEIKTPQSKLVLSTPPGKMEEVEAFYEQHKSDKYRAFKSQEDMFEFVHPELSKVYGIAYYCGQNKFSIREAVSFGDTTNDIEMIKECGTGVCMCNGTDDAKSAADIITQYSNDEDGLARELERILGRKSGISSNTGN